MKNVKYKEVQVSLKPQFAVKYDRYDFEDATVDVHNDCIIVHYVNEEGLKTFRFSLDVVLFIEYTE